MTAESLQPCDLVMQGAVATGVVYPPVILELKDHYRFRRIGGTSAGAIAAAGAAAAEYNREDCGFTHLAHMSDWLGADHHLRDLFQPSADTKPLMNLVDAIFPPYQLPQKAKQTGSKPSTFQSVLRVLQFVGRLIRIWARYLPPFSWNLLWGTIIGLVVALLLPLAVFGVISLFLPEAWYALVIKLAFLLVFGTAGGWFGLQVGGVVNAIAKLPGTDNFYGICSGHNDTVPNVLTDWLSDQLHKMAGLKEDKPLTFGDLKDKQPQNGQDAGITLRMITSNLSQGQPYVLPSGLKGFLFKEDNMRKLFPGYVVDHMVNPLHAPKETIFPTDKLPQLPTGYHFLPDEDNLPVVVAMRLSLSFPILLSAVPLYTINALAVQRIKDGMQSEVHDTDLQPNWFSDGGICNNFPIEFFDVWLPRWPTFGIDLTSMPAKSFEDGNQQHVSPPNLPTTGPAQVDPGCLSKASLSALDPNYERRTTSQGPEAVYLPRADAPQDPVWRDLQGVVAFLSAILGTGLGWQQTLQTNLPSYRDRVVQIRMSEAEDGLHLNMPPGIIKELGDKGQAAGQLLSKFDFEQHRWVRFRVLMAKLEENFEKSQATVLSSAPGKPSTLEKLLDAQASAYRNDPYPYKEEPQWCDEAKARVNKLRNPIEFWRTGAPLLFREDAPKPDTALRVTPEI